jgi:hypothetical protein
MSEGGTNSNGLKLSFFHASKFIARHLDRKIERSLDRLFNL